MAGGDVLDSKAFRLSFSWALLCVVFLRQEQATASLQSRLVLSDLSPGTEYVAVVRRTATAAAAAAAGEAGDTVAEELRFSTPEASRLYVHT